MQYLSRTIRCILGFIFCFFVSSGFAYGSDEVEIIRQRLISDAISERGFLARTTRYTATDFTKAAQYLSNQESDGGWSDIDYLYRENDWKALLALDRILTMAWTYSNPSEPLYGNNALLLGTVKALEHWYTVNPTCKNWFKNDIAKQMYLGVIAILLQGKIHEALLQKMIDDQTETPSMGGANRTLLSISVFYRGVLEKNPQRIASGVQGVMQQVKINQKGAVQADYSFHEHGPMLYNGNYGNHFLRETVWMAAIVEGTQFSFNEDEINLLRNYYMHGTRWMVYKNVFDYNSRGRDVGRPSGFSQKAEMLIPQLNYFMEADPDHSKLYQRSKHYIIHREPQDIYGNKHFWRSDYTVQYRNNYFTSLKMCSERTLGIETHVNSENLLGYYLPYGLTYIYRRGDEYLNIFPVWDWSRLPGVTSPANIPVIKGRYTQQTSFVGGVNDGEYGVSAMELNIEKTEGRKSWFWFDDEWVALGAGIKSENESEVFTGINQTILNGQVVADDISIKKGEYVLKNPGWLWHDSIGYVFPNEKNISLQNDERSRNLNQIYGLQDTIYRQEVFALWFEHGLKPQDESYSYIVIPNIEVSQMTDYSQNMPVSILKNTTEIQAVTHHKLGVTGIVFYEAGSFLIEQNNTTVQVDHPCLVLHNHQKGTVVLSDPTAKLKVINIVIKHEDGADIAKSVELPQGMLAGESVQINKF